MPTRNYKKLFNLLDNVARKDPESVLRILNHVNENQVKNKRWLIESMEQYIGMIHKPKVVIAAGWYGLLGHMISESIETEEIVSFDMDPACNKYGKRLYPQIQHKTIQVKDHDPYWYDVLICTSCEHFSDDELNTWLGKRKKGSLVLLQSNNYYITEHTNCKGKIENFIDSVHLKKIIEADTLSMESYDRFMLIGL